MADDAIRGLARAALVVLAAATSGPALAQDARPAAPATVTPLASTTVTAIGQPLVLPRRDARVIASLFDIVPGATLPVHKHPFPRYAYVLAGELVVTNVETGQESRYRAGDFIVEMIDTWHQGTAVGPDPVRLLVIDQVEGDLPHTLLRR